eukprot:1177214-Rhodomonas_salina.1
MLQMLSRASALAYASLASTARKKTDSTSTTPSCRGPAPARRSASTQPPPICVLATPSPASRANA